MITSKTKRLVTAALMLALGMLLPFALSHGYGIKGTTLLPMHIPVLLCGFFAGPFYGALCGLVLPVLNSVCTGMPVLFPMAVIMTGELFTYGLVSGWLYRKSAYNNKLISLYPVLIISMLCGRVVYGLVANALIVSGATAAKLSVVAATLQGIPGIIIQLVVVPLAVKYLSKNYADVHTARDEAVVLVKSGKKTCVVVKDNKIISAESPIGIAYIIKLHDKGVFEGSFVADTIIGKAAAMIFSKSGVKSCYGEVMSNSAYKWLTEHNISATYGTLAECIQNRKGDGMCPMEDTVDVIKTICYEIESADGKGNIKKL